MEGSPVDRRTGQRREVRGENRQRDRASGPPAALEAEVRLRKERERKRPKTRGQKPEDRGAM